MKTMPPMRHFLRLEQLEQPNDDFTEYAGTWKTVCDLWGAVVTVRAEQRVQNKLAELTVTHTITTRWDHRIPTANLQLRMLDLTNDAKQYNVRTWTNVDEMDEHVEWEVVEVR